MSDEQRERFLKTRLLIDPSAFIAPSAVLVGDVEVGADASVWYHTVLRGDLEPVRIGARSNVQDGAVVHVDRGHPAEIGDDVTIGHRAVIHGAILEQGCLVGSGIAFPCWLTRTGSLCGCPGDSPACGVGRGEMPRAGR